MSYESTAEPIKVGYLFDFRLPDSFPPAMRDHLTRPFEVVFGGAGYLVARRLDPDGLNSHLVTRFGEE